MNTHKLDRLTSNLRDYLTFYHEIKIPHNSYFDLKSNKDSKNRFLVVSSPSRMGNHVLLSMLDNHPELPRLPGEDGFLSFSFLQANYDIHKFINSIHGEDSLKFITHLGTNGGFNKWQQFKKLYENGQISKQHSGIRIVKYPAAQDFEGLVFDINYDAFEKFIKENLSNIRNSKRYNEILQIYLKSLQSLDYRIGQYKFDSYIVFGGMRTQLKWICMTYENTKILSSIRSFGSYAISHVNSRYGHTEMTQELIQEAWEHWYHKVIDLILLRLKFPDNIGLVTYENLIQHTEETAQAICKFLGINYHSNMQTATIFGIPVRGNPSGGVRKCKEGTFYKPKLSLAEKYFPPNYCTIWDNLKLATLDDD